jgi:hypothetical protein
MCHDPFKKIMESKREDGFKFRVKNNKTLETPLRICF